MLKSRSGTLFKFCCVWTFFDIFEGDVFSLTWMKSFSSFANLQSRRRDMCSISTAAFSLGVSSWNVKVVFVADGVVLLLGDKLTCLTGLHLNA